MEKLSKINKILGFVVLSMLIVICIVSFIDIIKPKETTYSLTINENVSQEVKVLVLTDSEKDEWVECDNLTKLKYGDMLKIENTNLEISIGTDGLSGNSDRLIISGVEQFMIYYMVLNNVTLDFQKSATPEL